LRGCHAETLAKFVGIRRTTRRTAVDRSVLAQSPTEDQAKDFIVEGLTYKLDQREKNVLGEKLKINIHPRVYYGAFDPKSIQ
jgi:hypothetical protein